MEEPKKDVPDQENFSPDTEGIVDELRNMISGLGESQESEAASEEKKEEHFETPDQPASSQDEKIGDAGIPPAFSWEDESHSTPPPTSEDTPPPKDSAPVEAEPAAKDNDKDFWSGNVLGWPSTQDPEGSEPPSGKSDSIQKEHAPPPSSNPEPEPEPKPEKDKIEPDQPIPPSSEEPHFPSQESARPQSPEAPPPPMDQPPPHSQGTKGEPSPPPEEPPPIEKPEAPPAPEPLNIERNEPPRIQLSPSDDTETHNKEDSDISSLDAIFPKGPGSDMTPSKQDEAQPFQEAGSTGDLRSKEPQKKDESQEETETPFSLPGTIETRQEQIKSRDMSGEKNEAPHEFEADKLVPKGVLQVSCLFPEGEEAIGQTFISNLKNVASRQRDPIDIQAVFIQAWDPNELNMEGMERSASMSGSQFTFLLVPKKDQPLFIDRIKAGLAGEWKGRIVYLEQIKVKTLYADLLMQLGRLMK